MSPAVAFHRKLGGQAEVNFRFVDVDAINPNLQLVPKAKAAAGTLAYEPPPTVAKMVVVIAQGRDVDQAIHVDVAFWTFRKLPYAKRASTWRAASSARRARSEHTFPSTSKAA